MNLLEALSFNQRFAPTTDAVTEGTFDPIGSNYPSGVMAYAPPGANGGGFPLTIPASDASPPAPIPLPQPNPLRANASPSPPPAPDDNSGLLGTLSSVLRGTGPGSPAMFAPGPATAQPTIAPGQVGTAALPRAPQNGFADALRDIMVGAASGPSNVSKTKAFTSGYAGSTLAGESRDEQQRKAALDMIDRAIKAKTANDTADYRKNYLDVLQQRADTGQQNAETRLSDVDRKGRSDRPDQKTLTEIDRDTRAWDKWLQTTHASIDKNIALPDADRAAQKADAQKRYNDAVGVLKQRRDTIMGNPTGQPGANSGSTAPASPSANVDVQGSLAAARDAIAKNPDAAAAIRQRLQDNGIDPSGL